MIDKESIEFLEWVKTQDLHQVMVEVLEDLDNYYLTVPGQEFKEKLIEKMTLGAREHKKLQTDPNVVAHEIELEAIDLVGWTLMAKYVTSHKK